MRCSFGGTEREERALTVGVPPSEALAAIRDPADERVDCPAPRPVHETVGLVGSEPVERRATLAAVARSRGHDPPGAERIEALRAELQEARPERVDLAGARRRVAESGTEVERLREEVATLRGRVQAHRESGGDAGDAEAELRETARELSEAETERYAAVQALERARERAREHRDTRETRFAREDELANLEREARAWLAEQVGAAVAAAVVAVPRATATGIEEADPVTLRLAAARVARLRAPVVLACRRFPDAGAASRWLDAPVLRVSPRAPPRRGARGTSSGA
jgi:hypothetical protein